MARGLVGPPGRRVACATLLLVAGLLPRAVQAQATAYVPTLDPAYEDLDILVSAGLVRTLVLGQKPYARAAFARAAAEAHERMDARAAGTDAPKARLLEALRRLEDAFGDEGSGLRGLAADVTAARSPSRHVPTRYVPVYNPDGENVDADLNPLLQSNQGRQVADGGTLGGEAWMDVRIGSRIAAAAHPRLWVAAPRGGSTEGGMTLLQGYVRGLFGNFSIDAGRNPVVHGHSWDRGPVLSTNARGLDHVRFSMEEPRRLPWIFRHLGPAAFAGMLGTLGDARDNPGSVLIVWEGAIRPRPNLEVGLSLLNQQGGKGAPAASFRDRVADALFLQSRILPLFKWLAPDAEISDKVMAIDVRLDLPGPGVVLYAEGATTDDHDVIWGSPANALWHEAAWTVGVRRYALGSDGRWDVWAEAGRDGARIYTHHQFTSGMTLDRRILGSPLGPLGTGWRAGADWTGPRDRVSVAGAWERYQGDLYSYAANISQRLQDSPDEIRVRATLDWSREPAVTGVRTTVRLGWEHVTRFDFTDASRSNFLAQVGVGWGR